MIYITGDKHGDFSSIFEFCQKYNTTTEDIMIVLGDAGINYYLNKKDRILKNELSKCPITLFCIHGNHEERPENISTYKTKAFHKGIVYYEEEYPNILFAKDGQVYDFNNLKTLVAGGAYSVDKDYRIKKGFKWFESELPDGKKKYDIIYGMMSYEKRIDVILTHTCPYKYIPVEALLSFVNQSEVDNSYEQWLDMLLNSMYEKWYCGHFHINKTVDKIHFLYDDILVFGGDIDESK